MKKAMIISIAVLFAVFLTLGIVLNSQQGLYYGDQFWQRKNDGSYVFGKDSIRMTGDGNFSMHLAGRQITAVKSIIPGGTRLDFSDGWAVEHSSEDDFLFDFGGYAWSSDAVLILTDMERQDFGFAPAAREERYPFYDETGEKEIGETIHILSEDGETLDYREVWFDSPEHNTPEREIVILEEGVRLPASVAYSGYDCILQNAEGEYLLEPFKIGRINAGGADTDRCGFTWFLLRIAQGAHETRGSAEPVAVFLLLYLLGAAQMIWPEQLAFFGSRWQFKNEPELSDAGLTAMRIGAAVVMFIGILALFVGL